MRAAWDGPPDPRPWQGLAEMGVLSLMAPESSGGLGLDETFLVPVIEEAGWAGLPQPLTATALVAAPLGVSEPMVATDLAVRWRPAPPALRRSCWPLAAACACTGATRWT